MTDVADALAPTERVRNRLPLRTGGSVVLTDDHLLVVSASRSPGGDLDAPDENADVSADEDGSEDADDGSITRVALDDVAEITVEDFDWFLGVLSVLLVGWGLQSTGRSLPLGLAFAAFGAASLYWSYRKRGKARIKVVGRPKPLSVFPADPGAFTEAMETAVAADSD